VVEAVLYRQRIARRKPALLEIMLVDKLTEIRSRRAERGASDLNRDADC
jgi:hypothetical protein